MKQEARPKFFYGYIIVITSMLIMLVIHGASTTYGVFFNSLQTEFNSGRATISSAHSLAFFFEALFAIPMGWLNDKYGPKAVLFGAGILLGLGYFLMSTMTSLWQMYLYYSVLVGISFSSANVALLATTTRWFLKKRGMMTSIVKTGTGAGILIMPLVATWLIAKYDWRNAYVALAIIGVIGISGLALLLKRDPGQMRLQPYGATTDKKGSISTLVSGIQLKTKEAMHTKQFWIICAVYFVAWFVTQSLTIHMVAYATDIGISAAQGATIISIIGGVSISGRLLMGTASDRIGTKRALVICFVALTAAMVWLQFAKGVWPLYLFGAIAGFAHGGFFTLFSPLVAEFFGTTHHGMNLGWFLFLGQIGGAIGPVFTGFMYDSFGDYHLAFIIMLVGSAAALLTALTQLKPVKAKDPILAGKS